METYSVPVSIADDPGTRFEAFDALVDTGASYTWIPRPVLEALGHTPEKDRGFELADGRLVSYGIKWITVRVNGRAHPTPVVFGDAGTLPLLGAVTLQEVGLGVDSLNERLIPTSGLLKGHA